MIKRGVWIAVLLLAPSAEAKGALDKATLDKAWSLYHRGRCNDVGRLVQPALNQLKPKIERRDAYLVLAACALLQDEQPRAESLLVQALSYDPQYQPDPLRMPPDLQQLLVKVKQERKAEIHALTQQRRAARTSPATLPAAASQPVARAPAQPARPKARTPTPASLLAPSPTPPYLAVLPFGVGQFQNGQPTKGWVLLGSEAILGATSLACLGAALSLRDDQGTYASRDLAPAKALNVAYLVTGYAALGLMLYGAIDGLLHRHAASRRAAALVPFLAQGAMGLSYVGRLEPLFR